MKLELAWFFVIHFHFRTMSGNRHFELIVHCDCRYCESYWRSDGVANCINSPLNYTIAIMQSSLQFECTHGFKSISKTYVRAQSATPAVALLSEIFFEVTIWYIFHDISLYFFLGIVVKIFRTRQKTQVHKIRILYFRKYVTTLGRNT